MTTRAAQTSPRLYARIAGCLYLLVIPLGILTLMVSPRLVVPGNAATTASNILASESLFRLGIVGDLLAAIVMVLVVLVFYKLLKPVSSNVALLMVALVLVGAAIAMLSDLNQFAALLLVSGADYLNVFTTVQLQALALLFLKLNSVGSSIAFVFWGLWLVPLGYLVFRSGFLPRILGALLVIAGFGYFLDSFGTFLGYHPGIAAFAALGEMLFILWLLIKGVNVALWEKRALAIA